MDADDRDPTTLETEWTPEAWTLNLVVELDGRAIGTETLAAKDFAIHRTVGTGSWLGQAFQGRGFGKGVRSAVLSLAFDGVGARGAGRGSRRAGTCSERERGSRRAGTCSERERGWDPPPNRRGRRTAAAAEPPRPPNRFGPRENRRRRRRDSRAVKEFK